MVSTLGTTGARFLTSVKTATTITTAVIMGIVTHLTTGKNGTKKSMMLRINVTKSAKTVRSVNSVKEKSVRNAKIVKEMSVRQKQNVKRRNVRGVIQKSKGIRTKMTASTMVLRKTVKHS